MKTCPFCAEAIQDAAIVCRFCQRPLSNAALPLAQSAAHIQGTWNPGVAAVLSVFIPGLGHIYKGWIGLGFVLLFVTIVGYALFIVPGVLIHIFVVVDAYNGLSQAQSVAQRTIRPAPTPEERARTTAANRKAMLQGSAILTGLIAVAAILGILLPKPSSSRHSIAPAVESDNVIIWENKLQVIVASAGERCPAGIRAFHQGMDLKSGYNFWNLRCSNGSAYSISLLDGQPSRVLSCDVLKKVSQMECFRTFTDQRLTSR